MTMKVWFGLFWQLQFCWPWALQLAWVLPRAKKQHLLRLRLSQRLLPKLLPPPLMPLPLQRLLQRLLLPSEGANIPSKTRFGGFFASQGGALRVVPSL